MFKFRFTPLYLTAILSVPLSSVAAVDSSTETPVENTVETGYIKDSLFIYMHAGAGKRFRILGSVNAGTPVEKLEQNSETGFVKIQDDKGRVGWIEDGNFTSEKSVAAKYVELQSQFQQLQAENQQNQTSADNAQIELESALQASSDFSKTLAKVEEEKQALEAKIAKLEDQKDQKTILYGAGILLGGLIFGLILPSIMPRRRRQERWV